MSPVFDIECKVIHFKMLILYPIFLAGLYHQTVLFLCVIVVISRMMHI